MDSDTEAESEMSLESRSFLHRVDSCNVEDLNILHMKECLLLSCVASFEDWSNIFSTRSSVFMGKEYSENLRSIKNTGINLTMKQMFDISEKLIVGQSDENYGVTPINCEDSSWKYLSLVGGEEVISLSHAKVYVFSDSVLCLGKMNQNPTSNTVWEDKLTWFKSSSQYRALDTIDGGPMDFERNIFTGFTALQL